MSNPIIKSALLSYGMSGRVFHAPFIDLHPGFSLAGAWERSNKNIEKDYPGVKSYASIDEILADPTIDLVVVNTPIYSHYEYALAALNADKHIIVEKAFTTNLQEALALDTLAKSKSKHIFVYQNRRLDSDFLTVKKIVDAGVLGELVEVEIRYDRFNGAQSPKLHKEIPGPGAGIVKDLGPHLIDQAIYLFGSPEKIFADLRMTRPETQVDDYFEILCYYPKLRVRLRGGYYFKEPVPSFQLHGKRGSFLKVRADKQETDLLAGLKPKGDDWGKEMENDFGILHIDGQEKIRIPSEKGNFMYFYENVFDTLQGQATPFVSAMQGAQCMQVIDAVFESHAAQKVIHLTSL
jgi:predicted dehydrogenase